METLNERLTRHINRVIAEGGEAITGVTQETLERDQAALEYERAAASKALKTFPRQANGLTPDHIKFSPEYRAAKARFDRAHGALRDFNSKWMRYLRQA